MAKLQLKSPRIENRKAYHDYFIEEKLECGLALVGSEVKSLRLGTAQISDSFAEIRGGQLYLQNAYIEPYKLASLVYNHDPKRPRVLLAKKREIKHLGEQTAKAGFTLVPLAIYFKDGVAKCEIGVGRGKKAHDKRDTIRQKETDREMRRAMTRRQR
jgi:SsrA-binding protein